MDESPGSPLQRGEDCRRPGDALCFGPFRFDPANARLDRDGAQVHLVPKACAVLAILLARCGHTVTREELFERVWQDVSVADESLTQAISAIRQALGDTPSDPNYIRTIPGAGYRFIAPVSPENDRATGVETKGSPPSDEAPRRPPVGPFPGKVAPVTGHEDRRLRTLARGFALVVVTSALGLFVFSPVLRSPSAAGRVIPFTERTPDGWYLHVGSELGRRWGVNNNFVALSPDGLHLAYVARNQSGDQLLYLRPLDGDDATATAVPGSEGASAPFFSPDGSSVGFTARGHLYRASLDHALPQLIAEVPAQTARWGPNDDISVDLGLWEGLGLISPRGDQPPRAITAVDIAHRENGHRDPVFLPDGSAVLYTNWFGKSRDDDTVSAVTLATGSAKVVLEHAADARYVEPGYLTFVRAGQLQVQAFDARTLEVVGPPVAFYETERGLYDASPRGDLAYIPMHRRRIGSTVVAIDPSGGPTPLLTTQDIAVQLSVSADGERLAVTHVEPDGTQNIWVHDTSGETAPVQVTFDGNSALARWAPDGRSVMYNSDQGGPWETYRVSADGAAPPTLLVSGDSVPYDWHPRLPHVVFGRDGDLWVLDLDSGAGPRLLFAEEDRQSGARFSPDGAWLAYSSEVEGRREIFVRSYPDLARRQKVSPNGGRAPRWARDGSAIFYINEGLMMRADIAPGGDVVAQQPQPLFAVEDALPRGEASDYDVDPEGMFLMVLGVEEERHTEIEVVLNWITEVQRRLPSTRR